jgi:hypothetical protein
MKHTRLRIWFIASFTLAVIAMVIRCLWQIVVIPTPGTMLIFISIIVTLLGGEAAIIYLVLRPEKIKSLPSVICLTVAFTAGLVAVLAHFFRFIGTPQAAPFFSKVIASLLTVSSISVYFLAIYAIWSLRRVK